LNQAIQKRHYFVRSFVLLGFSFLLANLLATGNISLYLAPKLQPLSYVTLVILVILAGASLRRAIVGEAEADCECPGEHTLPTGFWRSLFIYGLFVLPLAMFFLMPEKVLDSSAAQKKGVTLLAANINKSAATTSSETEAKQPAEQPVQKPIPLAQSDADIRKLFADGDFGDFYTDIAVSMYKQPVIKLDDQLFLDGLTTLELYPQQFSGHKLETMGFVYLEQGFKGNQFVVARFSVSCCTADANVFGILVETPNKHTFTKDQWVKVRGELEVRRVEETDMLVLKAEQIQPVKAPKDPYVYYSYMQGQQ